MPENQITFNEVITALNAERRKALAETLWSDYGITSELYSAIVDGRRMFRVEAQIPAQMMPVVSASMDAGDYEFLRLLA